MALASVDTVKPILQIPAGVTFHDVAIGLVVDAANDYVLAALGQPSLAATTRTDYPAVYTDAQQDVFLDRSPVVSVAAVTNAGQAVAEGDYRLNAETGMLRLLSGSNGRCGTVANWSNVPDDVVVTYLFGYTGDTLPARLTHVATQIAVHTLQQSVNLGKTRVRDSSLGFDVDSLVIPEFAAKVLAEFEDVHHS